MASSTVNERLLDGAGRIFYRDGFTATGTAALSKELQISKRTIYELYPSKDLLAAAVLERLDAPTRAHMTAAAEEAGDDPVGQLIGFFAGVERTIRRPGFRGCPFLNATAEFADPAHPARAVSRTHKEQTRRWFERTARRAGLPRPKALSAQLLLLLDGALAQGAVAPPPRGALVTAARALVTATG